MQISSSRRTCLSIMAVSALWITGCGPTLSVEKTMELEPTNIRSIVINRVAIEQTIFVSAEGDGPFHAHVILTGDEDITDGDIALGKEPSKSLGGAREKQNHSFSATIPANKEAQVRLESASEKTVNVNVIINN